MIQAVKTNKYLTFKMKKKVSNHNVVQQMIVDSENFPRIILGKSC